MYSKDLLWNLRTNLPMSFMLNVLGEDIGVFFKMSEGFIRFLCPSCHEMQATVNPKNNYSHCFSCRINLNNIDFLIAYNHSFKESVNILTDVWNQYSNKEKNNIAKSKLTTTLDDIANHHPEGGNYER